MKEGKWDRKEFAGGSELMGKTLAIIGLGRIGKEVAIRMKSYGMQIVGYDPFVTNEEADQYSIKLLQLEEIWPIADYITVHTPLLPQTKNLIDRSVFAKCVRGVKIINAARGGIVNELDLLNALEDGRCGGAALDVFSDEPPKSDLLRELISHPRVIATPHIGASTKEAQIRVAVEVAEQFVSLNDLASSFNISGVLNAPALIASRRACNTTWLNLSEQLGRILSRITRDDYSTRGATINISLTGPDICNMKFLSTSVLLGFLSGNIQNRYNLINSPMFAKEAGLSLVFENEDYLENTGDGIIRNVIKISIRDEIVPSVHIQGTVINNIPYLLQVNDAVFPSATVRLSQNVQIYRTLPEHISDAINAISSWNEKMYSLSIGYGNQVWIVAHGEIQNELPAVPNVERY